MAEKKHKNIISHSAISIGYDPMEGEKYGDRLVEMASIRKGLKTTKTYMYFGK
jgi:hypothetical protein